MQRSCGLRVESQSSAPSPLQIPNERRLTDEKTSGHSFHFAHCFGCRRRRVQRTRHARPHASTNTAAHTSAAADGAPDRSADACSADCATDSRGDRHFFYPFADASSANADAGPGDAQTGGHGDGAKTTRAQR
jgi:hypothetical protein